MYAEKSAFKGGDGVAGDGFAAADGVNGFVGFCFEIDLIWADAERFGESFAHRGEVRA